MEEPLATPVDYDPLRADPPPEIRLSEAPLERVIAQVRFPPILSLGASGPLVAAFQEAIRREYPTLREEPSLRIVVGEGAKSVAEPATIFRFRSGDGDWKASLTPDFMALETRRYTSRDDFLARLHRLLEALAAHVSPSGIDRLGLRYVDRVKGEANLADLSRLVRPEVAGIAATSLAPHLGHALTESSLALPDGSGALMARWGRLPPNKTTDPGALPPIGEPSWILDLDCYTETPQSLDPAALGSSARRFAERVYTFFRWAVTDEFLRRYGGQL